MKNFNLTILTVLAVLILSAASPKKKDNLIAKNATIQKAGDGFIFTEGPAVGPDGRVYFTDQPNDRIYIWDEKDGISLYLEGTGRSTECILMQMGNWSLVPMRKISWLILMRIKS